MTRKEVIKRLENDADYYGEFGRQYLSNSDIKTLLSNPLMFKQDNEKTVPMLVGGYFHTLVLEPEKLKSFKVIESSTRNTKIYKEISEGEMCLLQKEADMCELMSEALLSNDVCREMIKGTGNSNIEYEVPGLLELKGHMWKGKADILNHDLQLIIDIKTTSDLNKFRKSAYTYNYDSQAYIYRKMFGYDMVFIAIDKSNHHIGVYDCSDNFLISGEDKVQRAIEAYELFYQNDSFDPKQYFINETL
jgi:hypothetical protein